MPNQSKYITEKDPNPYFERWKYYIDIAENQRGEKLTEERLRKWADDPNRMLECVFCQIVEPPSYFQVGLLGYAGVDYGTTTCCPRCREYKGIQPSIPGWSDFE